MKAVNLIGTNRPQIRRRIATALSAALAIAAVGAAPWTANASEGTQGTPQSPNATCPGGQCFSDVPGDNPFAQFVNTIYGVDIVSGYPCGGVGEPCDAQNRPYYRPGANVTRGQMAKFVDNARHMPGISIDTDTHTNPIFARTEAGGTSGIAIKAETINGTALYGSSIFNTGVYGYSTTPGSKGVHGASYDGTGVYGTSTNSNGVYGMSTTGFGVYGMSTEGVGISGKSTNNYGVNGTSTERSGVLGTSYSNLYAGVEGRNTTGYGLLGKSTSGAGVYGMSTGGPGVFSLSESGTGVYGKSQSYRGVWGDSISSTGVRGDSNTGSGVRGVSNSSYGVYAYSENDIALRATNGDSAVEVAYFDGSVTVVGSCCSAAEYNSRIDHPQDPANKYLQHALVQSDEMVNVYSGNVTTDVNGDATVQLPGYFETTNSDYRYQLTPVGQFAQAIISKEIAGNSFSIKTDKPSVKVSWQVTGVRKDPYAKANPIEVAPSKPEGEKGLYLQPELYGQPESKGIGYEQAQEAKADHEKP